MPLHTYFNDTELMTKFQWFTLRASQDMEMGQVLFAVSTNILLYLQKNTRPWSALSVSVKHYLIPPSPLRTKKVISCILSIKHEFFSLISS